MPDSIQIAEFVFGALLLLIALLGGNFKLFGAEVTTIVSNRSLRFLAFMAGAILLVVAIFKPPSSPSPPFSPAPLPTASSAPSSLSSSPSPSPFTNSSESSPSPAKIFSQLTPGEWRGETNLKGIQNPMSLLITKVTRTTFVGEIRTPLSSPGNPDMIEGEIAKDFGDVALQSYWKSIPGFNTDKSGVWFAFMITSGNGTGSVGQGRLKTLLNMS